MSGLCFPFRYFSVSVNGYRDRMWYVGYVNSGTEGNVYSERKFVQRSMNTTKQGMWGMCLESHGKMQAAGIIEESNKMSEHSFYRIIGTSSMED